ncbi:MAG TPA: SDR family NAD(P)-dependent oxidoreductase [Thermoflexia bacterium]|nr:SDR family NAD(P)-dependent oxidoreductase [Thermoflexia bacterium]
MEERVVIITGANSGIGLHLATSLLEEGYRVAGFDLSGENLVGLQRVYPDRLLFCRCDVTDGAQVEAAVRAVVERWGRIDILVNNACLALFKPFEKKSLEETRREFEVNYFGYVRMIAAVLPQMKGQGGGIIHNVGSGVGITGFPGIYGYASTKGAIEALTRTLALELAPYGICVNLIHPPLTNARSASPLGVPAQAMADPAEVGRRLARKILSTKPVVTPDFKTAAYLFFARRFPDAVGRLFGRMAVKRSESR